MNSNNTILVWIKFLRPVNFIITAATIFVSCILAGGVSAPMLSMIFASFGGACIGGGGMVINDIFDIEIDRINKPERPLPSGAIAKFDAVLYYAALSSAGLMMSYQASWSAFLIALFAVPAIFLYSFKLKFTSLVGNILVGLLTGLTFFYGGAAVGTMQRAFIPAMFAFLINVGREVIKDMEDVVGDEKLGASTFPIKHGMKASATVATIFLLGVIVSTLFPFFAEHYGIKYFILVNIGVNAVLVYLIYSLWNDMSERNLHFISTILKYDMLVGLLAIYLG